MIIYNVTVKVSHVISSQWLEWMKSDHIPEMIATECFTEAKVLELLEVDTTEGPTYAVQYFAESKSLYNRYIEQFSNEMREKSFAKWGDKFIAFRSVMKVVN